MSSRRNQQRIRKYFKFNKNKNLISKCMRCSEEETKEIVLNACVRKESRSYINNLSFLLKILEADSKLKPKARIRMELID